MAIRRLLLSTALVGLMLGLASLPASADPTQITLGGTAAGSVIFTGDGSGNVLIQLGSCTGGSCTLSGTAFGTGALTSGLAPYEFTSTPGTISLAPTSTAGLFAVTQTASIGFSYGTGGSLLTGTLSLLTFTQTPGGSSTGEFNTFAVANLVITGGSLSTLFPPGGAILTATMNFGPSPVDLATLSGSTTSAKLASGQITPTPEPGSMLLLGSGLLAVGAFLRRRRRV